MTFLTRNTSHPGPSDPVTQSHLHAATTKTQLQRNPRSHARPLHPPRTKLFGRACRIPSGSSSIKNRRCANATQSSAPGIYCRGYLDIRSLVLVNIKTYWYLVISRSFLCFLHFYKKMERTSVFVFTMLRALLSPVRSIPNALGDQLGGHKGRAAPAREHGRHGPPQTPKGTASGATCHSAPSSV